MFRLLRLWRLVASDLRLLWFALLASAPADLAVAGAVVLGLYALDPVNFALPFVGIVDDLVLVPLLVHLVVSFCRRDQDRIRASLAELSLTTDLFDATGADRAAKLGLTYLRASPCRSRGNCWPGSPSHDRRTLPKHADARRTKDVGRHDQLRRGRLGHRPQRLSLRSSRSRDGAALAAVTGVLRTPSGAGGGAGGV